VDRDMTAVRDKMLDTTYMRAYIHTSCIHTYMHTYMHTYTPMPRLATR
jgi:hypothetical protein